MQSLSKAAILEIANDQLNAGCLLIEGNVDTEAASTSVAGIPESARRQNVQEILTSAAAGDAKGAILKHRAYSDSMCSSSRSEASIWQMRATRLCLQGDCPSFHETLREGMSPLVRKLDEPCDVDSMFEDAAALGLFCPVLATAAVRAVPPDAPQAHLNAGTEAGIAALGLPPRLVQLLSSEHRAQALRSLAEQLQQADCNDDNDGSSALRSTAHAPRAGDDGESARRRQAELPELPLPSLLEAALMLGSDSSRLETAASSGPQGNS